MNAVWEKALAAFHFHELSNGVFFKRSFDVAVDVCGLSELSVVTHITACRPSLGVSVCDLVALPFFATNTSSAPS